ncbi:MAG TPA: hypothetical protein EYP14_11960 [Planctomycetaceae bacterium]|nr:hypothetical protein [Planctomycetaceae bacterium]
MPRLVPGGAHQPNPAAYFLTGRVEQWLDIQRRRVRSTITAQQPDGSFRYRGKFQRGHFEDTASGWCAQHAPVLLEHARLTGDRDALGAGLRALEYMKRFRTPRGAQTWELSLHTPDILASAHLVWCYVRGYELTGRQGYLHLARKRALSGVPFVYQWSKYPIMAYATIPVYGATHWRAPNWMGLPVQWCGLRYAYAIALLAPYDDTLNWKKLAQGILNAGEQMQYPDGPLAGCLPDVFRLESQERAGPSINPCALVSLRLMLEGDLDSLAVARVGDHRLVAPFPIEVRDGRPVVHARRGLRYQVLLDGERVLSVESDGEDSLPVD